ncbi:hypothetical protein [Pedobacter sp. GR22-6]
MIRLERNEGPIDSSALVGGFGNTIHLISESAGSYTPIALQLV